ncbi:MULTISPECIES: FecR family protein [unclassified Paraburkholderia]|uniref:FecR family protein n=1 Tax=unclassified Paraburkholderia TaxID=2615204 RepID=UPI002AAF925F|nr:MULTISPECIES: FecR domain-containing protein [unclassified Paraburkholderia]
MNMLRGRRANDPIQAARSPQRAAIEWEVRLRDDALTAHDHADFEAWRGDDTNAQAWEALQTRLARLRPAAVTERAAVADALRVPSEKRRKLLRAGFGSMAAVLGFVAVRGGAHRLGLDADWRSAIGERNTVNLADGSRMTIDAGSHIYRTAGSSDQILRVSTGQILVQMPGSHAGIARRIETAHGFVETVGGTLDVGRIHRHSVLAVRTGEAWLSQQGRAPLRVPAGESIAFSAAGPRPLAQSFELVSAWTRGIFVADNLPLDALVDVFNRYSTGVIRVTGAAADVRVSGVFLLDDVPRALTQVADSAPVELTRIGDYLSVFS